VNLPNVQAALADAYLKSAAEVASLREHLAEAKALYKSVHDSWQDALNRERDYQRAETQVLQVVVYQCGETQTWVGTAKDWAQHVLRHPGIDPGCIDDHFAVRGECVGASELTWPTPEPEDWDGEEAS
jgi:hypothetical protein